jgi:putative MFS transporter
MFAGYLHDVYIGTASAFFLLLLLASFFSNASFSVVFPYMAELWPAKLRASGFGLVYGCSNIAKFIGPAGLAVIAGDEGARASLREGTGDQDRPQQLLVKTFDL